MTPERLQVIREQLAGETWVPFAMRQNIYLDAAEDLLAEVDRLRHELSEARLDIEEAWDAHDEQENA